MFDATRMLGGLLENGRGQGGGMLQQILARVGGGQGMLEQAKELARRAAAAPGAELQRNNPAAIGGLGALAGALMGGGRGAVGGGLLALLGSLGYAALQNADAAPAAPPAPATPDRLQGKARLVIRAMIQAAMADGHLDDAERDRLTRHLAESGGDAEARAFIEQEMARPVDPVALAAAVQDRQEAAEIYAASVMAISVDTDVERSYLSRLATALDLPAAAVGDIQARLASPAILARG